MPHALRRDAVHHDGEGTVEGAWSGWSHFILWAESREQMGGLALRSQDQSPLTSSSRKVTPSKVSQPFKTAREQVFKHISICQHFTLNHNSLDYSNIPRIYCSGHLVNVD